MLLSMELIENLAFSIRDETLCRTLISLSISGMLWMISIHFESSKMVVSNAWMDVVVQSNSSRLRNNNDFNDSPGLNIFSISFT